MMTDRKMRVITLALVVLCALVLLCVPAAATNFRYIPVMNVFAEEDKTGCLYVVDQTCRGKGGYVAADVTDLIKENIGAAVTDMGITGVWYSFLGADTTFQGEDILPHNSSASALPPCAADSSVVGKSKYAVFRASRGCMWRWNTGRWQTVEDIYDTTYDVGGNTYFYTGVGFGVGFLAGNFYDTIQRGDNAFPIRFNYEDPSVAISPDCTLDRCMLRPNFFQGQQLMAVGNGANFAWSDGRAQGGYPYSQMDIPERFSYNGSRVGAVTYNTDQADTLNKHVSVCITYNPVRADKELFDATSKLQNMWWVIYLVFLVVICFIIFLVSFLCQEREDMDEPPEDAPEWAREEIAGVKKSKAFVSQRNMQTKDDEYSDTEKFEEMDNMNQRNPLLGAGARRGSRRDDGQPNYQNDPDYYPVNAMQQGYPQEQYVDPAYAPVPQNNNWV